MTIAYAAIMTMAIATGVLCSRFSQRGLPLRGEEKIGIGMGALCGAMIGAKVPFVLADWPGMLSGAAWFADGKTILCGLVGGYFGVEVAKWALEIRIKTGDSFAVPVAASVGVGRLACFTASCCFGTPTTLPWGVVFSNVDGPRHPTQLYECAFHLSLAAVLFVLQQRGLLRGQLIKLYILSYVLYRFFTEYIRPEARLWGELTGYQWASVVIFILFVWLWVRDMRKEWEGAERVGGCEGGKCESADWRKAESDHAR